MARTHEDDKLAVKAAVQDILNALNGGNQKVLAGVIYETVSREHRTLQQAFWSALLLAQITYADNDHDLRNEQAVELAKTVRDAAKSKNFDFGLACF